MVKSIYLKRDDLQIASLVEKLVYTRNIRKSPKMNSIRKGGAFLGFRFSKNLNLGGGVRLNVWSIKLMRFILPVCRPPRKWSLNHKDLMEIEILNLDLSHGLAIVRINEENKLVPVRIHSDFDVGDKIGEMVLEYNEQKILILFSFKRKIWNIDKVKIKIDDQIWVDW